MEPWIITVILLCVFGGVFFAARLRGYLYIGASFLLVAFCIIDVRLIPSPIKEIIYFIVLAGLIYFIFIETRILKNRNTDRKPERKFLVILGAEVNGTEPSLSLFHRLQAALEYLNAFPASLAVACGGRGNHEQISEADCMFNWLTSNGISSDRILLEDKSVSTEENLRFALDIILNNGGTSSDAAVLSSPYHLYRAKLMAREFGYDNVAGVACVHGYPVFTIGMYIREAFGVTHFLVLKRHG